jgi:hypothetical protein
LTREEILTKYFSLKNGSVVKTSRTGTYEVKLGEPITRRRFKCCGETFQTHHAKRFLETGSFKHSFNCIECGKETETLNERAKKFCDNKSCGVMWRNKHVYRYKFTYSHRNASTRNFLKTLLTKKNRKETLSIEFLEELLLKQNGLCAITKEPLTFIAGQGRIDTNVSIDQIVPGKGYTEDNVQLVCRIVNSMKFDHDLDSFVEWCRKVVYHNE